MFWLRNKENIFELHTFTWRPGCLIIWGKYHMFSVIPNLLPTADGSVKEGNVLRVIDEYLLLYEAC